MLRLSTTVLGMIVLVSVGQAGVRRPSAEGPAEAGDGSPIDHNTLAGALTNGGEVSPPGKPLPNVHPSHVLVRFRPGATRAAKEDAHKGVRSLRTIREFHAVDGLMLVEVPEGTVNEALAVYRKNASVLYAEPDCLLCVDDMPNDTSFGSLWGLHNTGQTVAGNPGTPGADIQAVQAWNFWTGDPDFRIAVIDTGVDYTHPDLAANIWTNEAELNGQPGVDDDGNGYIDDIHGYDFRDGDGDPMDEYGHGTHVAGTIGAVGNNLRGVVGVNWQCKIVVLRTLSGG